MKGGGNMPKSKAKKRTTKKTKQDHTHVLYGSLAVLGGVVVGAVVLLMVAA